MEKGGIQIIARGNAEPNNDIVIEIAGALFEGTSGRGGNFAIEVTLGAHGENDLLLFSKDAAGNNSVDPARVTVIRNNPPTMRFLQPRAGGGLNHGAKIFFEAQDPDGDEVTAPTLSYRKRGGEIKLLASEATNGEFFWNVSNFVEGTYELLLTATDGTSSNTLVHEVVVDNTVPTASFKPLGITKFNEEFVLSVRGTARDNFSGVEFVEYSIEPGNWFKATITSGYRERNATYKFTYPFSLSDGTYHLSVRATDVGGNVSPIAKPQEFVIDTTPPRIGSYILSASDIILFPEDGAFVLIEGTGAHIRISLERDTEQARVAIGEHTVTLERIGGLWEADLSFPDQGTFPLLISAEDSFGKKITRYAIGTVRVEARGNVISSDGVGIEGVKMNVLTKRVEDNTWVPWQAEAFGLQNPLVTNNAGEYTLLLPAGTYQILLEKQSFRRVRSSVFSVTQPRFVIVDFELTRREGLRGFWENMLEKFMIF